MDNYKRRLPKEKTGRHKELKRFCKSNGNFKAPKQRQQTAIASSSEERQEEEKEGAEVSSSSNDNAISSSEDEQNVHEDEQEEVFGILKQQNARRELELPKDEVLRR